MLLETFVPSGPLVLGLDDTIERRWGGKIQARGIYRDPVRSSNSHFVKTSGLRWRRSSLKPITRSALLTVRFPGARMVPTKRT